MWYNDSRVMPCDHLQDENDEDEPDMEGLSQPDQTFEEVHSNYIEVNAAFHNNPASHIPRLSCFRVWEWDDPTS